MTRVLKFLIYSILGLIVLVIGAVAATLMIIDPNDYKPDIEKAVADNTQLTLKMTGDLGWSLIPLGLRIGEVSTTTPDNKEFTRLNQLTAEIDLFSLFEMAPRIQRVIIDGLTLNLYKDKQGVANWTQITKPQTDQSPSPTETAPEAKTAAEPAAADQTTAGEQKAPLKFNVDEVAITNTTVNYQDDMAGQKVSLKGFNLHTSDIGLDKAFPLSISFEVQNQQPKLDVNADINIRIFLASTFKQVRIPELDAKFSLAGEPFAGKTVKTSANAALAVDLDTETLDLEKLILKFANLQLNSHLKVTGFKGTPGIEGDLAVDPFSLQQLLQSVGQATIPTTDPDVLQKIAFSTQITTPKNEIQLANLKLVLDDTLYNGKFTLKPEKPYFALTLAGNELNADRYMPPAKDPVTQVADAVNQQTQATPAPAEKAVTPATASTTPEAPLLPLKTIRGLNFDVDFKQERLIVKNLKLNQLKVLASGADGLIELKEASGKLYEGGFTAAVRIDARTDDVKWHVTKKVTNIQTLPLLTDLAEITVLSGGVNIDADVKTRGNTVSALKSNAKGEAGFNFDKGIIHGFNLTALTCNAVSMINKDKMDTSGWPQQTNFRDMKGRLLIDGNTYTNKPLVASLSGIELAGDGVIHMDDSTLNYGAELNVVGELGDNACRINDRVKQVPIPVRCKGKLDAPECGLDMDRLSGALTKLAKKEIEHKAEKEIDKQLDKHLDKYLGGEDEKSGAKKEIKKLFKGLF